MIENRRIINICALGCLVSFIVMSIMYVFSENKTQVAENIVSGIFTGFLVSMITTYASYMHYKSLNYRSIYNRLSDVYMNTEIVSTFLGGIFNFISDGTMIANINIINKKLKLIDELAKMAADNANQISVFPNKPTCKKSSVNYILRDILLYKRKNMQLKYVVADLVALCLNVEILVVEINTKSIKNQDSALDLQMLQKLNLSALVKLSKVHEFSKSLSIEADKLLNDFSKCTKTNWKNDKQLIDTNIREIIQEEA